MTRAISHTATDLCLNIKSGSRHSSAQHAKQKSGYGKGVILMLIALALAVVTLIFA